MTTYLIIGVRRTDLAEDIDPEVWTATDPVQAERFAAALRSYDDAWADAYVAPLAALPQQRAVPTLTVRPPGVAA